jgi:hypothetical protein
VAVRELVIEHLSGIGPSLAINFAGEGGGGPRSLLLFGDNGSGKSSVIDGLEFALQARVRNSVLSGQVYEALRSHASDESPHAVVKLDDGELVERVIDPNQKPPQISPPAPHSLFAVVPIALRRADLTRFWDTPERQRQVLFRGFFESPGKGGWMRLGDAEERALGEQREELKAERRQVLETLIEPLGLLTKQVPLESLAAFDQFVAESFPQTFGRHWPIGGPSADPSDRRRFDAAVSVRRLTEKILGVQRRLKHSAAAPVGQTALAEVLREAHDELNRAFIQISPAGASIEKISLFAGGVGDVSLRLRVELVNGRSASPEELLSEANLDLLALLVFTSILRAAAEHGQAKVLVLDDVIQSVDAAIRTRLLEYLLERFTDWQLILTTHDRFWREQVRHLFVGAQKPLMDLVLSRWSLAEGPVLRRSDGRNRKRVATVVEEGGEASVLCSAAGLLLEELCQEMSWRLPVKLARNRHDRYMLGELWPLVAARLTELGAQKQVADVDRFSKLRNLVGAHHTEAGQMVSDAEAADYAVAAIVLWDAVNCPDCHGWLSRKGASWACGCGKTALSPS